MIHIEAQSSRDQGFARRMFRYFGRLHDKFDIPIYPVALLSYDLPLNPEVDTYIVEFPDIVVNSFHFRTIQLNRLNWRDFLDKANPVAAALMAKMQIASEDRPKVKFECMRLLATLKLDPARMQLTSGFIDNYLKLTAEEDELFNQTIAIAPIEEKEIIMQIVTSWMEQGMQQGELALVIRQLARKLGNIPVALLEMINTLNLSVIEELGDALLYFNKREDLEAWLRDHGKSE